MDYVRKTNIINKAFKKIRAKVRLLRLAAFQYENISEYIVFFPRDY